MTSPATSSATKRPYVTRCLTHIYLAGMACLFVQRHLPAKTVPGSFKIEIMDYVEIQRKINRNKRLDYIILKVADEKCVLKRTL